MKKQLIFTFEDLPQELGGKLVGDEFDKEFYEGDSNSIFCRKHKIYATPFEMKRFISEKIDQAEARGARKWKQFIITIILTLSWIFGLIVTAIFVSSLAVVVYLLLTALIYRDIYIQNWR